MNMRRRIRLPFVMFVAVALLVSTMPAARAGWPPAQGAAKTRIAIVGLDHDHVWSLLKDISQEPAAELVAIAEADAALVSQAKKEVPATVLFFSDYVQMLDQAIEARLQPGQQ